MSQKTKKETKLPDALEQFRLSVCEKELVARHNKAEFEKMFYYLEAKKISSDFLSSLEEDTKDREKLEKEVLSQIKDQVNEQNSAKEPVELVQA